MLVQEALQYLDLVVKPLAHLHHEVLKARSAASSISKEVQAARQASASDARFAAARDANTRAKDAVARCKAAYDSAKNQCRAAYRALLAYVSGRGLVEADRGYEELSIPILMGVS